MVAKLKTWKILLFGMAMCGMSIASCSKMQEIQSPQIPSKIFYALTPSDSQTRTYIDKDFQIHWTEEDRLSVFRSPVNEQYRYTGPTGKTEGSFEKVGEVRTGAEYSRNYAIYPYSEGNCSQAEGTFTVMLPAIQHYAETSFGLNSNTMVAVTGDIEDEVLKFKNACGYLMLKLYGGDTIKKISFYGNRGERIAGEAEISLGTDLAPKVSMTANATTEISLDCGEEGVATSLSKNNPTIFWIVVPPTDFEEGFTIEIVNTSDQKTTQSTLKHLAITQNSVKPMSAIKLDLQTSNELLSFSLSDGTNTYKAFDISDGYVNVQVPNGTDMSNMTATFNHNGASVKVNGVPQTSGVDSYDFSDFVHPIVYTVTATNGMSRQYSIRMFNLPVVVINTPNRVPITSKTVWVEGGDIQIWEGGEVLLDKSGLSIKGRGNSSWTYPKKPYAIKLDKKTSLFGLPKSKRWVLLNNYLGYLSNPVGHELARRGEGVDWEPDGTHVELILNGEHKGLYDFREQIKLGNGRIETPELSPEDTDEDKISGGYLMEFDEYYNDEYKFRSALYNYPINLKSPDEDVPDVQFNYIKDYINNLEASLKDPDRLAAKEYLNYLDIDSFIDIWFAKEMSSSNDFPVPKSVWLHKKRDGKLCLGPAWDFDGCLFNKLTIKDTGGVYLVTLFNEPYFVSMVKSRWPGYKANILGEGDYAQSIVEYVENMAERIRLSAKRDADMWGRTDRDIDIHRAAIVNGLPKKIDYMEQYINSLTVK